MDQTKIAHPRAQKGEELVRFPYGEEAFLHRLEFSEKAGAGPNRESDRGRLVVDYARLGSGGREALRSGATSSTF